MEGLLAFLLNKKPNASPSTTKLALSHRQGVATVLSMQTVDLLKIYSTTGSKLWETWESKKCTSIGRFFRTVLWRGKCPRLFYSRPEQVLTWSAARLNSSMELISWYTPERTSHVSVKTSSLKTTWRPWLRSPYRDCKLTLTKYPRRCFHSNRLT